MTLKEAYNFFESLKKNTIHTSEIKIYEKFLHILSKLKTSEFSKEEMNIIETELDNLNLLSSPKNKTKHFNKALQKFKTFLKNTFSLTTKGYYIERSIGYGVLFGVIAGVLFGERFEKSLGLSLGISIGLLIGLFVGRHMESQAKSQGKML